VHTEVLTRLARLPSAFVRMRRHAPADAMIAAPAD
jgi:hypothetical protein